jgi:hypothetical protein
VSNLQWRRTGDDSFPLAASDNGRWVVLRANDVPSHPRYTMFRAGLAVTDIDDWPVDTYGNEPDLFSAKLAARERQLAMATVKGLRKYGAESGNPCEDPWCCGPLDDDDR